jgi:hypothetical protein
VTRLRQRLASWLLDLAVRVEPVVPAAPNSPPRVPVLTGLQPSPAPGDPYARQAGADLRRLASSVEDGHVVGFRVVWHGAPHPPEVWFYVPNAIGEA